MKAYMTNPSKTPNLFANPPDTVRDALHALHNGEEEAVRDLHEHCQPGRDNGLYVRVRRRDFRWYATREVGR